MMTGQPWGFWEWERVAMQAVFLVLFVHIARTLKKLIRQGIDDRHARMLAIEALKETADTLSKKTAAIAAAVLDREAIAASALGGRLDNIDGELRRNSQLTQTAATASAEAAEVANSVNSKISETNKRLLEHVEGAEKK